MRSEFTPWNVRLIAILMLVGGAVLYHVLDLRQHLLFSWFLPLAALVLLWWMLRAPHSVFSLEAGVLAWSRDLKRQPLTRIATSEICEIYVLESRWDDYPSALRIVDSNGDMHKVGFLQFTPSQIWRELRPQCPPSALFVSLVAGQLEWNNGLGPELEKRLALADIREVHVTDPPLSVSEEYLLIVDCKGEEHRVITGRFSAWQISQDLEREEPARSFTFLHDGRQAGLES